MFWIIQKIIKLLVIIFLIENKSKCINYYRKNFKLRNKNDFLWIILISLLGYLTTSVVLSGGLLPCSLFVYCYMYFGNILNIILYVLIPQQFMCSFFVRPPSLLVLLLSFYTFPLFAGSSGPMSYVSVRVQINTLLIRLITHFEYIYMYMYVWNYIWEGYTQIYIWQCIFIYCTTTIEKE